MMWLVSTISGRVRLWLTGIVVFATALLAAYLRGKHDAEGAAHDREINEYVETRRRIDEAATPRDSGAAHEWLRKRQSERNL